jgi:hypothetical protein
METIITTKGMKGSDSGSGYSNGYSSGSGYGN